MGIIIIGMRGRKVIKIDVMLYYVMLFDELAEFYNLINLNRLSLSLSLS